MVQTVPQYAAESSRATNPGLCSTVQGTFQYVIALEWTNVGSRIVTLQTATGVQAFPHPIRGLTAQIRIKNIFADEITVLFEKCDLFF